ncbi:MAG TPA: signal peptidase I [Lachnospiraceae bacterium]|nr:signal peptidase I [Lachnospiraceae bacterium]
MILEAAVLEGYPSKHLEFKEHSTLSGRKNKEIESIDEAKEIFYSLADDRKQEKRALREAAREEKRLAKEQAKEEAELLKKKKKGLSEDEAEADSDKEEAKAEVTKDTDSAAADTDSEDVEDSEEKSSKKYRGRKKKKEKVNILKELYYLAIYIGIVIVVCFLIITFVGERTTVQGDSMLPTLTNNDSLWIDKISYRFTDPKRFDVIIFPPRNNDEKIYIKRIIGLPGETVQIDEKGNIFIDGKLLEEDYGLEIIESSRRGVASSPVILGHNEYFVMGDNRNNSMDSRSSSVGNVKRDEIIGKAVFRLAPFKKFGKIK